MKVKVVHVLLYGLPLCLFTRDFPRDWPEGHVWTEHTDMDNISCSGCKEKAEKIIKEGA